MNATPSVLLQQLGYRMPVLLTCLVGIVLSLSFWRRAPRPCLLVLLASSFEAVLLILNASATAWILSSRQFSSAASIGTKLTTVSMMTGLLSPVPYVLLMIAAFIGRSREATAAFPVTFPQAAAPPPLSVPPVRSQPW